MKILRKIKDFVSRNARSLVFASLLLLPADKDIKFSIFQKRLFYKTLVTDVRSYKNFYLREDFLPEVKNSLSNVEFKLYSYYAISLDSLKIKNFDHLSEFISKNLESYFKENDTTIRDFIYEKGGIIFYNKKTGKINIYMTNDLLDEKIKKAIFSENPNVDFLLSLNDKISHATSFADSYYNYLKSFVYSPRKFSEDMIATINSRLKEKSKEYENLMKKIGKYKKLIAFLDEKIKNTDNSVLKTIFKNQKKIYSLKLTRLENELLLSKKEMEDLHKYLKNLNLLNPDSTEFYFKEFFEYTNTREFVQDMGLLLKRIRKFSKIRIRHTIKNLQDLSEEEKQALHLLLSSYDFHHYLAIKKQKIEEVIEKGNYPLASFHTHPSNANFHLLISLLSKDLFKSFKETPYYLSFFYPNVYMSVPSNPDLELSYYRPAVIFAFDFIPVKEGKKVKQKKVLNYTINFLGKTKHYVLEF